MTAKISEIVSLDAEAANPVLLLNMYKYWDPLFSAKGFRGRDRTYPQMDCDGSNVMFVAGEKQLYRGYIGGLDVEGNSLRPPKRPSDEQLKTYVAKRNRVTGKMQLVEVESCQLANISHDQTRKQQGLVNLLDLRTLRTMQQKFISKSSQALQRRIHSRHFDLEMMDQKLRQMVADGVVKEEDALGTASTQSVTESDEVGLAKIQEEIRAKANREAKKICDLYKAESLIGSSVLIRLTGAAKKLLQTSPEELSMANEYLDNRVKALMQSADVNAEVNLNDARICLFMDVLVRLISTGQERRNGARKSISPYTQVLDETIQKEFMQYCFRFTNDRPTITKYTRQKALMYYLALAFILEGQALVSCGAIHSSLRVSKQEFIMFARAIGARYNPTSDKFSVGKLEAPRTDDAMQMALALDMKGNRSSKYRK